MSNCLQFRQYQFFNLFHTFRCVRFETADDDRLCIGGTYQTPSVTKFNSHTIYCTAIIVCSEILSKSTPIPSIQTKVFQLSQPNQTAVIIKVLQGENGQDAKDCLTLGHFELNDLPPRGDLIGRIEVTFSLDNNGLLTAKARDIVSGKEEQMQINYEIKPKQANVA